MGPPKNFPPYTKFTFNFFYGLPHMSETQKNFASLPSTSPVNHFSSLPLIILWVRYSTQQIFESMYIRQNVPKKLEKNIFIPSSIRAFE
uniref:Ovule protein n=1 Tax=Meloidogyne incognita TaxID=6306 RepID=A0A914NV63_MELIC